MILKNKGLYLESVINYTLEKYSNDSLAYFYKIPLNSTLISVDNNILKSKLTKNIFCDYIGIYKGAYIEFEAKETELDYFNLSNIKKSQFEKLEIVSKNSGVSFIVVYFHKYDKYYGLSWSSLLNFNTKKISFDWFERNGFEIFFDGRSLGLIDFINHLINCI